MFIMRRVGMLLLGFCLCCAAVGLFPSAHVLAASNPIQVVSRAETTNFPGSYSLDVTASDASSPITSATIFTEYHLYGPDIGPADVHHDVPITQPGHTVTLHDREDTSGTGFVLPGTPIDYYWQFQDSAGNTFTDAPQSFTYIDTRFNWQHLSQGLVQVNWYNQSQDFGQTLLTHVVDSLKHITQVLGQGPTQPLNLWIYATHEDFLGGIGPNNYEWVGGQAEPNLGEAFLVIADANDTTVTRDLPHEMTHLVFAQIEPHAPSDSPLWFNEGLAVYNQSYHEAAMQNIYQRALEGKQLLRFEDIAGEFPVDSDQAYLAYAQSWQFVSYLYDTYGTAKMHTFLKDLNNPITDFSSVCQEALGLDEVHLENQWRLHLNQPSILGSSTTSPTQAQTSSSQLPVLLSVVSAGIVVVIIVVFFVSRRRPRQQRVQNEVYTDSNRLVNP